MDHFQLRRHDFHRSIEDSVGALHEMRWLYVILSIASSEDVEVERKLMLHERNILIS